MSFVDQFAEKIRNFDPAQAQLVKAHPIESDDVVIGIANDAVKKIYGIRQLLAKKSLELLDKYHQAIRDGKHPTYCDQMLVEAGSMSEQAQVANNLLWLELYNQFPRAKREQTIALRDNWQVVFCKKLEPEVIVVKVPKHSQRDLD